MKKIICLAVSAWCAVGMMSGVALSAEKGSEIQAQETIIIGTINNAHQLVAKNGQIFDVVDTEEVKELFNNVGMKVQVNGTVMENEGKKQIYVSDYFVIKN